MRIGTVGRHRLFRWVAVGALMLGVFLGRVAAAEGVFVSSANRVDIAYDDLRGVLYISEGPQLLRFDLSSRTFLAPLTLGGSLNGMDISPDGSTLVVADTALSGGQPCIHLVNLVTLATQTPCVQASFGEGGSFTAAYGSDGSILVATQYQGSGWVPLRRYFPAAGTVTQIASVRQNTMLRASADHSVIALAESNISDGEFDSFVVATGAYTHEEGYTNGTSAFNYEIAVSPDAQQFAIPTYLGTVFTDANLAKLSTVVGTYAGGQPIGVAYNPVNTSIYFPWAGTSQVYVYDRTTLTQTGSYNLSGTFGSNGNYAFVNGRAKTSGDGRLLFVTVDGGVRYVTLDRPAPTGLAAVPHNDAVALSWNSVPNATSYVIYAGTLPNAEAAAPVATGITATSASISGLANGTNYFFTVAAVTAAGTSTPSDEVTATPVAPPQAVSGVIALAGNGQVAVSWNATLNATSYTIYQGTQSGGESVIASGVTATNYAASGLTNGTSYYFEVSASNSSGQGPLSAEVSAMPLAPPDAPSGLVATAGNGIVTLRWNQAARGTGYDVYASTSSGAELYAQPILSVTGTSTIVTGLANGLTYYFVVTAINTTGASGASNEASATPGSGGGGTGGPIALYDPGTRQLSLSSVQIGDATYTNLVVMVASIASPPTGFSAYGTVDTYDPAGNLLTVQSVTVGANTYYNAVVSPGALLSIGSVTGGDTYDATTSELTIPSVNVLGGSTYRNVAIRVGGIISVGHGLPGIPQDLYVPSSRLLLIPVVEAYGRIYTNVVVTVGSVVSGGP